MKKVVEGKVYDTDTATEILEHQNGFSMQNFRFRSEILYKTKKGAFFIYRKDGSMSRYARLEGNVWAIGEVIRPASKEEARDFIEKYGTVKEYTAVFGKPEEA